MRFTDTGGVIAVLLKHLPDRQTVTGYHRRFVLLAYSKFQLGAQRFTRRLCTLRIFKHHRLSRQPGSFCYGKRESTKVDCTLYYQMRLFLILCSFFVIQVCFADEKESPILSVYLPDYRVKAGDEPRLYGTTNLVLFSAKPRPDGSVDFARITPELLAFAAKARVKKTIKITVCVGGWGRGKEFAAAVSTTENRGRFVNELAMFCEAHQLDGIDIDWEFPKSEKEHADLAAFLELLSGKLKPANRILTIALGYTRPLPETCWQWIDHVNLMSYQPWNVEPYEAWLAKSIQRFLAAGCPAEKLVVGVGFFAKEKGGERRAVSWRNIGSETDLPASDHGFWPVGKTGCDLRIELVTQYQLGGVMVWDYGHDKADPGASLLRYLSGRRREP